MSKWICITLFLGVFWMVPIQAQNQENTLDRAAWQELTEGVDYTEKVKERKKDVNLPNVPSWDFDLAFIKYLFFGIVLAVLIFVLVRYVLTLQGTAKATQDMQIEVADLQQAEENLLQANLVRLIEQLVDQKKYREATRAYFLLVLQRLHKNGFIRWKKPKTNFDYVHEVRNAGIRKLFSEVTSYFERTWYGKQDVDITAFKAIEPQFVALLQELNPNEK